MQRYAERRPDVAGGKRIGERDSPWLCRRFAVAAAGEETAEAADDMSERNAWRKDVARRPERQTDPTDVPQRDNDSDDEAAVEDAARSRQCQELARVGCVRSEVGDDQQQLRANERADDDVDAEVEHAVRVEAAVLRPNARELQTQQVRRGQQNAVRVDRNRSEERERPRQLKQSWVHAP